VTAVLLNLLVMNFVPLFNGDAGLAIVPAPLQSQVMTTTTTGSQWGFTIGVIVLLAAVFWLVRRLTESPYGRTLRAMRDNDKVADSLGKNLLQLRTGMLVAGGAIAGLSGGVLVTFISVWSPAAWTYAETIVLFAAVIIGGRGNHLGALLGAIIVPVGFEESTRLITDANPSLPPNLLPSLQWVAIGLLIALFLWFRPQGVLPERRRVIAVPEPANLASAAGPLLVRPRTPPADDSADRDTILQAIDVSRDFGGVRAVSGVSLSVARGTVTGLIGPNGAGKSTLLAVLAGTDRATSGTVRYDGEDVSGLAAYRRARLGLVRTFQLASEFKRLTVMENLLSAAPKNRGDTMRGALGGRRYWDGDERATIGRAADILRRFGLTDLANSYAGDLSGGQRRLVEIMRALMTDPAMLLLDEPMAGVHPELAHRIGEMLIQLSHDGLTVLMVEHELAIMEEFCDPVIVMADGSVLAQGTMAQLRERAEVVEAYLVG
jgi:ABC-type branched-subunit amino acid transport system ATPase component/ABC-type uncharacterized transport system permease subunit